MFRINKLTMYSFDEKKYTYQFSSGLNYFKGKNSSGKTEFYKFLDFMFGGRQWLTRRISFSCFSSLKLVNQNTF